MVFRKRGALRQNESWYYNNIQLDIVSDFVYLGATFNSSGSFATNHQTIIGKGLKAMNVLFNNTSQFDLSPKTLCQLFDAFVGSILNYACETWGYSKSKDIERIHLKFCKRILNVKLTTSNAGVYGELGRYPLYISRYNRIIKYWLKLIKTDNCILKAIYNVSLFDCLNGKKNWSYYVKTILYKYGFGYIWEQPYNIDEQLFCAVFKQRLIDNAIQEWNDDLNNNRTMSLYRLVKNEFGYEKYLNLSKYKSYRQHITKIRLSSHKLRIETGRYGRNRIDRNERLCQICNCGDIEDELSFILLYVANTVI